MTDQPESTVYICTTGEYENYHICAVFTDNKAAEALKNAYGNNYGGSEIELFRLNPLAAELKAGKKPYFARVDKNGHDVICEITDINELGATPAFGFSRDNRFVWAKCMAENEAKAVSILQAHRLRLLAENAWADAAP